MTQLMNKGLNAKRAEQWDRYLVPWNVFLVVTETIDIILLIHVFHFDLHFECVLNLFYSLKVQYGLVCLESASKP